METWEDWTRLMNPWVWECAQCAFKAFADEAALQAHQNKRHNQGEEEVMNGDGEEGVVMNGDGEELVMNEDEEEVEEEEVWIDNAEEDEVEVDNAEEEEVEEEDVGGQIAAGEEVMCLFCKKIWASAATLELHQKKYRMKYYKKCPRCKNKILTKADFYTHLGKCKVKVRS